jgi:glycosyltransferase involved in cell wall biosynthesis
LFRAVSEKSADADFLIIGPDRGSLNKLKSLAVKSGMTERIHFLGERRLGEIVEFAGTSSFYLAMSVVEAMQLGLVPVVTPVGAISTYCKDGESAIFCRGPRTAERVLAVLADAERFHSMSAAAVETWKNAPLYHADFVKAALEEVFRGRSGLKNEIIHSRV